MIQRLPRSSPDLAALLGQEPVGGTRPGELGDQRLVGAVVGGRDEVARPLQRNLQVLDLAEVTGESATTLSTAFTMTFISAVRAIQVTPGGGAPLAPHSRGVQDGE